MRHALDRGSAATLVGGQPTFDRCTPGPSIERRARHICGDDVSKLPAIGRRIPGTAPAEARVMNNLMRGGLAGVGAWWLGGGLFTTLIIFAAIWWFLGHFH